MAVLVRSSRALGSVLPGACCHLISPEGRLCTALTLSVLFCSLPRFILSLLLLGLWSYPDCSGRMLTR